jgi:alkaline phosphatase D
MPVATVPSTRTVSRPRPKYPRGLVVPDPPRGRERTLEAVANADGGVPRGRELEIAPLLGRLKAARAHNVVWVTADVHAAAAHHCAPARA